MRRLLLLALAASAMAAAPAPAPDNWPQWRGPDATGATTTKNLPITFSPTENVTWKLAMPDFTGSTPIVWNDRVFLHVADGSELHLVAVDRNNGTAIWRRVLGAGNVKVRKQNMSSPSPTTDGKTVWVMTGTGVLKAFDFS
ncbi:MAG: PQQ-binding-like beta-propeller repeat protein, partial [Bacteroidales bacterium]